MDDDPLKDTLPPRYAIESDEEDEFNPLGPRTTNQAPAPIEVQIQGNVQPGSPLVIATGQVAGLWAKGADLGEQIAAICVNKVQVGLVFKPTWTQATVIVSETFTKLPFSFMHPYSAKIFEAFQPSAISLLGVYSSPTYSSKTPVRLHDAPIRYLSTSECNLPPSIPPFQPPSLIQETTASFLSLATFNSLHATAILVPSSQTPTAPPKELLRSHIEVPVEGEDHWATSMLQDAHKYVFKALSEESAGEWHVKDRGGHGVLPSSKQRRTEVGEGGMYL
ncbi:hypothetical protein BKA70DRAFT_1154447 [Coprinopsis sp. MPI-PUGE-AT-0042]|nr:hypothetical protein BKA70DRAFT_1154447 [Coprinopsis sp. MPI-PUGE-AT-0042]